MALADIMNDIRDDFQAEISIDKTYRARQIALRVLQDRFENHFEGVRDYCAEVLRSKPSSTVLLSTLITQKFERLYICLIACKNGLLNACRPIISVDACHLRGFLNGQILTIVGIDVNDKMYLIAFSICEGEIEEAGSGS